MTTLFVLLALWLIFVFSSSFYEGVMYHVMDKGRKMKFNEHILLTVMRASVLLVILTAQILASSSVVGAICFQAGLILTFPFLHDSVYYQVRNWLSNGAVYPMGWMSTSDTTTAWISFNARTRALLLAIGIAVLTVGIGIS